MVLSSRRAMQFDIKEEDLHLIAQFLRLLPAENNLLEQTSQDRYTSPKIEPGLYYSFVGIGPVHERPNGFNRRENFP
jgi:hypothetical protein